MSECPCCKGEGYLITGYDNDGDGIFDEIHDECAHCGGTGVEPENKDKFPNIILRKDGNQFMAAWSDFTNIQESECFFGDTKEISVFGFLLEQGLISEE